MDLVRKRGARRLGEMGGVVELVKQRAVAEKERADEPGHGEDKMSMGHGCADSVDDEGTFDERAALVARGAEAALLAGKCEEEFVVAVGAIEAGEAGVEVAAIEEGAESGGSLRVKGRQIRGVIVEYLPDAGGAGLAGAVADADHLGNGSRWACRRRGQGRAIPKLWGNSCAPCANWARFNTNPFGNGSAR